MNKLKKVWQKLKRIYFKKKRLVIVLSLVFILMFIFFIYYGIALALISDAEINLAALRESVNKEKICHEDCLLKRKEIEKVIIAAIKKPEENLLKRLENYFNNPLESFEFKKEIINLWRLSNNLEKVPQYFYDYLDKEDGDIKLQKLIINSFLSPSRDKRWLDYYFSLLASARDYSLKKAALIALSNREDKAANFNLKQLVFLKTLLFSSSTPVEIRADIVLLIGEYYSYFHEDTDLILTEAYKSKELDSITRAYAADILNRNTKGKKLALPTISGEEWEKYYSY
jgi:hypothetical protein